MGDPSLGVNYTLTSIIAVVLGGTSIFGGRGSYVGAFLGAVLIQELVTQFQGRSSSTRSARRFSQWLLGILILVGAGVYSRPGDPVGGARGRVGMTPRAGARTARTFNGHRIREDP